MTMECVRRMGWRLRASISSLKKVSDCICEMSASIFQADFPDAD